MRSVRRYSTSHHLLRPRAYCKGIKKCTYIFVLLKMVERNYRKDIKKCARMEMGDAHSSLKSV